MCRITVIAHGLGNGGAERVASILANGLSKKGNEVQYIAVYNGIINYELDENIEYIYVNEEQSNKVVKYYKRSKKILTLLKEFNPNVVVSFVAQEMVLSTLFGHWPIVFSERTNPASKPKYLRIITDWVYRNSYRVVFQTIGAKNYFGEKIRNKGYIIANPMENALPTWKSEEHNKDIITACRITPEKNLQMMIKAFARCHEKFSDYRLVIYGTPRHLKIKEELVQFVNELNLSDVVIFPGFSENIRNDMAEASMFLLTSNYEGLSNSMLEALCIGVPTICTDCPPGGAAMYIKDGENGFLVPVNDDVKLAENMMRILNDEKLQKSISEKSQKLRDELRVEKIVEKWIDVLNLKLYE